MANDIPEWAVKRACDLANAAGDGTVVHWRLEDAVDQIKRVNVAPAMTAFARYIAAHEEAPVDPLLIEAREIAAVEVEDAIKNHQRYMRSPASYRSGENDDEPGLKAVLAALRRGIELAKAGEA